MDYPKTIRAAVLTRLGGPLEIIDKIRVPELCLGQVLVKINYAGLCHSQLMEVRAKRGEDVWIPHMLGHEGTGVVIDVGEGVSKVKVGDEVILGWIKGDGMNVSGARYEGPNGMLINSGAVTTFSDYTIVSENRLVPLPMGTPLQLGVLYGCALPTGAGIILNELELNSESTVAIFGLGGIGLSALMAAVLCRPKILIAIDVEDEKLKLAESIGATHTINPESDNLEKSVFDLTEKVGLDYVVEAAGKKETIEQAFKMIRRGGKCIFASHPPSGDTICIDPFELICGKQIVGSWGGASKPDRDVPILGKYYRDGKLKLEYLLSHTYKLDEINQALDDLEARKIVRALIEINPVN